MYRKVAVVIPAYNSESTIEETINSVLSQTFVDFEIIVVNDGSTDRTKHIVEKLMGRDSRIKLHTQENHGLSAARNTGIRLANSTYVAFLDSDDHWLPDKLSNQLRLFDMAPCTIAVASNFFVESNRQLEHGITPNLNFSFNTLNLIFGLTFIPGSASSIILRSEAFDDLLFDEDLKFAEDLDFWIRLTRLGLISICDQRDVVIKVSDNGMQNSRNKDPIPYLHAIYLIVRKNMSELGTWKASLLLYNGVFQVLKTRGSMGVPKSYIQLYNLLKNDLYFSNLVKKNNLLFFSCNLLYKNVAYYTYTSIKKMTRICNEMICKK